MKRWVLLAIIVTNTSHANTYKGHGRGSVPEATLKKFAPPKLPTELKSQIELLMDVRSPGSGIVTEDGKRLFFSWNVTGVRQVWRLDGPNSFPVQMTAGEDQTNLLNISPDSKWIFLSRDKGGAEYPGLFIQSADGGPLELIYQKDKVQTALSSISRDGKFIIYKANDKDPQSYRFFKYDMATKKSEVIFEEKGNWSLVDSWEDRYYLMAKSTGAMWREYYEFDINTKQLSHIIGKDEKEDYTVRYTEKRTEYFVLTPKFRDFNSLYRYDGKNFQLLTGELNYDVSEFSVSEDRERVTYQINEGGYFKLKAAKVKNFKAIEVPRFENVYGVYEVSNTQNSRYSTLSVVNPKSPRQSYVYDWQKEKLTQWLVPSLPEVNLNEYVVAKVDAYKARDGVSIPMVVYEPPQCESVTCPVIVDFHGGPEGQSTPSFWSEQALYMREGFILVEPNVRGSDGYGKKWLDSDNGPKRLNVITDIEDAAIELKKRYTKNGVAPKIGVTGGSYGGYSTLYAMTKFAGAYDAGVAVVGMSNLLSFLENTAPYRRILRMSEYGDPVKDKKELLELSPITHLKKLKDPLLIIQGANDPRVPAGEAVQMYESAKRRGKTAELILFAEEGHGAQARDSKVLQNGHTLLFFKKHLK